MHIVFEHSTAHPLPIARYGGTERVLFWLMKALVKLGHEVSFIGHPGSKLESFGIRLIPRQRSTHRTRPSHDWRSLIPPKADVLHLFATPSFPLPVPCLVTIEGNGKPGEIFHPNSVFISRKHAENHGASTFVYNPIDLAEYPFHSSQKKQAQAWDTFLFLAKASWKVKNLKDCIRACRKTKKHLHIAGGRQWSLSCYLHSYGMVDQAQKLELLKKCDALLFPVRWHEPFGIAVTEAMAMGRPVIASHYGSLPELIRTETGILCKNVEEFEEALRIPTEHPFNPEQIRSLTEARFAAPIIASQYVALYEKVLRGESLNSASPRAQFTESAETLLPF